MAVLKCKMCGGDLMIEPGATVAECEYCGSRQTIPTADSEKKLNLFNRANDYRSRCEFDTAKNVYETIIAQFPKEAEAYWGLLLCRYGVEYVNDPATGKKIPTSHRSSYTSVLEEPDYRKVLELADSTAKQDYILQAQELEQIRSNIISISNSEPAYDVFICYKETDDQGRRTLDSKLGQELYNMLTEKGYRVFFARMTLRTKLGQEYEPFIFAALHSAKVMLVLGTKLEYYNAVWVRNEWSRFLEFKQKDNTKMLIPCYKNMDAYDLPMEFQHLQCKNMDEIGAELDIMEVIQRVIPKGNAVSQSFRTEAKPKDPVEEAFQALNQRRWKEAAKLFGSAQILEPDRDDAYLGSILAHCQAVNLEELKRSFTDFSDMSEYRRLMSVGSPELKQQLPEILQLVQNNASQLRLQQRQRETEQHRRQARENQLRQAYSQAEQALFDATVEKDYLKAAELFDKLGDYDDAQDRKQECLNRIKELKAQIAAKKRARSKKKWKTILLTLAVELVVLIVLVGYGISVNGEVDPPWIAGICSLYLAPVPFFLVSANVAGRENIVFRALYGLCSAAYVLMIILFLIGAASNWGGSGGVSQMLLLIASANVWPLIADARIKNLYLAPL